MTAQDIEKRFPITAMASYPSKPAQIAGVSKKLKQFKEALADTEHALTPDAAAGLDGLLVWDPRNMDSWTIPQDDGPNHLGLRCDARPAHRMAPITSGLCAPSGWARGRPACRRRGRGRAAAGARLAYSCNPYAERYCRASRPPPQL